MDNLGHNLAEQFAKYILPFLMVVAVIWAIWLAVAFGSAKDEQSRQNAKNRLVKAVASILIVAVCWYIMWNFMKA
jgi:uncharacterized membrane protein